MSRRHARWRPAGAGGGITRHHWLALGICVLLQILEGYSIFILSVVAADVKRGLGLSIPAFGLVLSAGLAGMMIGSLLLPALADFKGRRSIILLCLALATAGMVLACFSRDGTALIVARILTGLGVGGAMPVVSTAVAELAHGSTRNLMITISAAGYPAGGLLAAYAGWLLLPAHGWRPVFGFGVAVALVCALLVLFLLPESVAFLLARRPKDALARVNRSLVRLGRPTLAALPEAPAARSRSARPTLLEPEVRRRLGWFALATFLTQFSFYFFLSWLPALLEAQLRSPPGSGAMMLNVGGIVGDAIFGAICLRADVRSLGAAMMMVAAAAAAAVALGHGDAGVALPFAFLLGGALYGAMASVYSTAPTLFTIAVRSASTGAALSLGRLGGALSPWLGALLLARGTGVPGTLLLMALPLVLAAAIFGALRGFAQVVDPD